MKIAFLGDLHFRLTTPINRVEKNFWDQCVIPKWENIHNVLKQEEVEIVIFSGDIFDSLYNVSSILIHYIDELFKKISPIKIYSIYGNHDLSYYSSINFSPFNLLVKLKRLNHLSSLKINDWEIIGEDYEKYNENIKENQILVTHSYVLSPTDPMRKILKSRDIDVLQKYKYVIVGHYHKPYIYKNIYSPGIVYRTKKDENEYESFILILDTKNIDNPKTITIKRNKNVFLSFNNSKEKNITDIFSSFVDNLIERSSLIKEHKILSLEDEIEKISDIKVKEIIKKHYNLLKYEKEK